MTAETFTSATAESSVFSTEKKKGGNYPLGANGVTLLSGLTAASTVADVLDVLSTIVRDGHVVGADITGFAESVTL